MRYALAALGLRRWVLAAVVVLASAAPAAAQSGGGTVEAPAGSPRLPFVARPAAVETACDAPGFVCVHRPADVDPTAAQLALREAVAARRALDAAGARRPPDDALEGGSPAFDVYLDGVADAPRAHADPPLGLALDGSSSFVVAPPPGASTGCVYRHRLAQALAHASLLGLDAGAEPGGAALHASWLASIAAPCGVVEIAAVDRFQRTPERGLISGGPGRADGGMLLSQYLDEVYGNGSPGRVMTSVLAVSSQRTPAGAEHWHNEPDVFDALRLAARDREAELADVLLDFAVHRAFVGSRSDGQHLRDVRRFGDLGRVRFEWSVDYASLPRRLAPRAPIDATGMTYLWLDLGGAPAGASLTFVADWELPVLFRWALVRIGEDGTEEGRINVAGPYGKTQATQTLVNLGELSAVLIVGMNLGDIARDQPFDPDDAPHEAHGYTVTLYPQ